CLPRLGDEAAWQRIGQAWQAQWQQTGAAQREGMERPMRGLASRLAVRGGMLARASSGQPAQPARRAATAVVDGEGRRPERPQAAPTVADASNLPRGLWDDWARGRRAECTGAAEGNARRARIPAGQARARLAGAAQSAGDAVLCCVQSELRAALARPGAA